MDTPVVVGCAVGLGNAVGVGDTITAVSVDVGLIVGATVDVSVGISVGVGSAGWHAIQRIKKRRIVTLDAGK
jgi:hypothetical protein